ncbi:arginine--tRNA ligase [Halorhodospira abdelmalekii]|uniref:arginine--tRNA ligase n=1 Tax=Halorhodospira abdelmalekii TaxID=421629 RepID=UPI001908D50F|nr:arginine--tRNA ligase [Halorhodospira abdelmalekii]MBK1734194.1 arginine--tRNA ligase [Halorhodospira abdelmalekii]
MKRHVASLITQALQSMRAAGDLTQEIELPPVLVERARDRSHGDYAANTAMLLAKSAKRNPRELAESIRSHLPDSSVIAEVAVAGPGFLNFTLTAQARHAALLEALEQGEGYGRSKIGAGEPVHIEFVSANPTGPLHVGHGRGAAFGDALASLLEATGYAVHREYYVNDAGRQMDILALSLWLRYLAAAGESIAFPSQGYRGDYIVAHAEALLARDGTIYVRPPAELYADLPADGQPPHGDAEAHLDALIARARELLGEAAYRNLLDFALDAILGEIQADLAAFGVRYHHYFSERTLRDGGHIDKAIEALHNAGQTYEAEGALWFRATAFGDDKDRVLRRENGLTTYFAADVAYHLDKVERGYHTLINVWGADHHGYVPRVKAALQALGIDPARLDVRLVQFAVLYRGGEKLPMSTRSGEFVTLRELREEVGKDAARFFYAMRRSEQHMDFDLDLAKSESSDNPVYYCQYAHARVCSVFRQLAERGLQHDHMRAANALTRLDAEHEQILLDLIGRYPEVLEAAALAREPHQLINYLRELAAAFHTYYNAVPFIIDDDALRDARLTLIAATRQVLANALRLLGVESPRSM